MGKINNFFETWSMVILVAIFVLCFAEAIGYCIWACIVLKSLLPIPAIVALVGVDSYLVSTLACEVREILSKK